MFIVRKIFILILCFAFLYSYSENECDEIKNKKALKLYDDAVRKIKINSAEAMMLLQNAVQVEPNFVDAYYVLASLNYDLTQKEPTNVNDFRKTDKSSKNTELYFNKVIEICPAYYDYFSYYYLGLFYYYNKQYDNALKNLKNFTVFNKKNQKEIDDAKIIIKNIEQYKKLINNPVPFDPKSLNGVSSNKDEFLPLISPDGEMALYTRRYMKQDMNSIAAKDVDEFSFSKILSPPGSEFEVFDEGSAMPSPFNEGKDQGGVTITIDNKHLYLSICEFTRINNQPYKNCDLYTSSLINDKWTAPINMGPNINGKNTWEGQPSISADGKILYFASAREGGYGGLDIYYSVKDANGNWSKAVNLGNTINTSGNEKSPFIHTDSQTLYFSSDGHIGMGGFDIFYSKQDDFGKWSMPVNIGFPINTEEDDLGFVVSTDGKKAYFSSNKLSGKGGWDIYSFELYEQARPEKVVFMKGQLVDNKGEVLTDAKVSVKSTKTAKVTEGMVDKNTGDYALAVAVKKDEDLLVTVKKDNYAFTSQYIKPIEKKTQTQIKQDNDFKQMEVRADIPIKINFELKPIEIGQTIKLNNIYFETNSSNLKKESIIVLDNFMDFLLENKNLKISIIGHTDNVGDDSRNMILSNERAKAVYDYLFFMGIPAERMTYTGKGESQPIATNETEEGRTLNRRTEFMIIEK